MLPPRFRKLAAHAAAVVAVAAASGVKFRVAPLLEADAPLLPFRAAVLFGGWPSGVGLLAALAGVETVETYKLRAMAKLGFDSRVDAVRYADRRGWLDEA